VLPGARTARYLTTALLVALFLLAATSSASAGPNGRTYVIEQGCSPVYGLCWSDDSEGGDIYVVMQPFEHGGQYQVCVSPPHGSRACRPIRLRHRAPGQHGDIGFANRVDVEKSFGFTAKGTYKATWLSYPDGLPLSPTLFFTLPIGR
jgi:hypothetical protein